MSCDHHSNSGPTTKVSFLESSEKSTQLLTKAMQMPQNMISNGKHAKCINRCFCDICACVYLYNLLRYWSQYQNYAKTWLSMYNISSLFYNPYPFIAIHHVTATHWILGLIHNNQEYSSINIHILRLKRRYLSKVTFPNIQVPPNLNQTRKPVFGSNFDICSYTITRYECF